MKAQSRRCLSIATNATTSTPQAVGLKYLISAEKYSSASRLFRVTAYVMRFICNTRGKKLRQEKRLGPLSTEEILDSEGKELQKAIEDERLKELAASLGPFVDSQVVTRCKGRLMNCNLPYETKYLALISPPLPRSSYSLNHKGLSRKR